MAASIPVDEKANCIRQALDEEGVPQPEQIAELMCHGPDLPIDYTICIGEILLRSQPDAVWSFIGRLQNRCPRYRETVLLLDAVRYAQAKDPVWGDALRQSIRAEVVFDPELGEGPVQLLEYYVQQSDWTATTIVEEGGRGAFGGDPRQCVRAAVIFIVNEKDPLLKLAYIESVLRSKTRPDDPRLGSMLVGMLIGDHAAWPSGNCTVPLELVCSILEDEQCKRSAAAALIHFADLALGPECEDLWRFIQESAQRCLGSK